MDDFLKKHSRQLDDFGWVLAPKTLAVFKGLTE